MPINAATTLLAGGTTAAQSECVLYSQTRHRRAHIHPLHHLLQQTRINRPDYWSGRSLHGRVALSVDFKKIPR